MRHIPPDIIHQSHVGLQSLVAQVTIHLVQLRHPAPKVVHLTMMGVYLLPRPAAAGLVLLRMTGIIPLLETDQNPVVMCPDRLMTDHLGLHRPPGCLLHRMAVEVTTLGAAVIPEMTGHITTCLHHHAVIEIAHPQ